MSTKRRTDTIERLLEAARVLGPRVEGLANAQGVSPTGMRVLRLLDSRGASSTSEVAGCLNLADESVSRELKKLVSRDYVSRETIGRTNRLKITAAGWAAVRDYKEGLVKLNRSLLSNVHLADFHAAMERLESRLSITVTHAEGKPSLRKRKRKPPVV